MASPDNLQVTRSFGVILQFTKISFSKLYLRQILTGSGANQSDMIEPDTTTGLGKTAVNNWGIYDGIASDANLIALGQGMHTQAGNWHNWFTMVFQGARFKGSTLQIMGSTFDEPSEWAIVGGTGEFVMAQGVIQRKELVQTIDGKIQELTIEAYCRLKAQVPTPTKTGPWAGKMGVLREMEGKSQRLESLTIRYANIVEGMSFTYINEDGEIRDSGRWGGLTPGAVYETTTIKFGPSEFVKEITGIVGNPIQYLANFKIVTNIRTYGPFGTWPSSPSFSYTVPVGETVVGFFAYASDTNIHTTGVYTI